MNLASAPFPIWDSDSIDMRGVGASCRLTLTAYMPATQALHSYAAPHCMPAVVICPGGAYRQHASHEGKDYAEWLASHGVACFVLHYRLGAQQHRHPAALHDLARATRFIRVYAPKWNIDPRRIGVMGSSAGGHLASLLMTDPNIYALKGTDLIDRQSCRPDFGVLCYPVISMGNYAHTESRTNLLGPAPTKELIELLSSELHVTDYTAPCFIWHTAADTSVNVENSLRFASALRRSKVAFELHVYETGPHGMGLNTSHPWAEACLSWLRSHRFIKRL
jgi:acetyl esterase/lipase